MLTRAQKEKILNDLMDKINKNPAVLMVDFTGLKVADLRNLRRELKSNGMELKVVKKTLVQKMLSREGIDFNVFTFPASIALVFSPEEGLMASKIVYRFSSEKRSQN